MKISLDKDDIAIIVRNSGISEAYIPTEEHISWTSIHKMLREIRKLERIFTDIVNKTYKKDD